MTVEEFLKAPPVRPVVYPAPILRVRCRAADPGDGDLGAVLAVMTELMRRWGGIGLAAPQVGLDLRCFVIRCADGSARGFVNPLIVRRSPDVARAAEGCLSLPGVTRIVTRAKALTVSATDDRWEPFVCELVNLEARIVQHELSHLNGVLITDQGDPRC